MLVRFDSQQWIALEDWVELRRVRLKESYTTKLCDSTGDHKLGYPAGKWAFSDLRHLTCLLVNGLLMTGRNLLQKLFFIDPTMVNNIPYALIDEDILEFSGSDVKVDQCDYC